LRKWFFSKIDGHFIIPGKMAEISFAKWDIPSRNIILLPNLISNEIFGDINKYKNDINKKPVFFIVARLEENIKGILNFIKAIGIDNIRKIQLNIAGEGGSLKDYISYVEENDLESNVKFLGNLTQHSISNQYKHSNIFVLPSYSDPSPLSLVEAITSGLPVLVSKRCGNHFEAVEVGKNGYTFDPSDPEDIKNKFEKMMMERNKWVDFSNYSKELSKQNFDNDRILKGFINSYLGSAEQ
jgi:glycosyltransferase involved in cell wall biosynthesis